MGAYSGSMEPLGVVNDDSDGAVNGNGGSKGASADGLRGWGVKSMRLWMGSSVVNAWLISAAGQIGQNLITLPYSMAQMGYAWGICCTIFYGVLGAWTVYLLVWLYLEFNARMALQGKVLPERHILQYHEIIGGLTGKWGRNITYLFVLLSLFLASIVQLIASASDLYYANANLDKRQWQYIVGGAAFFAVFVPNFGHFRLGALIGVLTTSISSVYMISAALAQGQVAGVKHSGANEKVDFFTGATVILSAFGGHGITIEILESMKRPSAYRWVCVAVTMYSFAVVIPSSTAVYWSAGDILLKRSNAFAVLPIGHWRTMAISSLIIHQAAGFVLFSHPVFLAWEKAVGVHTKHFMLRVLARIPMVGVMWLIALAVPFLGPINSVIGAFGVAIGMYSIPAFVFILTYRTSFARQHSAVKLPPFLPSWTLLFIVNGSVVLWCLVVGVGFGGWASIKNLVRQINTFGFFDSCYQCPKPR